MTDNRKPHPSWKASMCDGKAAMSFDIAKKAAQRGKKNGGKVAHYHCKFCGQWHLGQLTNRANRRP